MTQSTVRHRRSAYRWLIFLLCGLLAGVGFAAPVSASGQATLHRGDAAAGWLARQMVDGDHFETEFDGQIFPDQGLTIDAVYAFAATKEADDFGAAAMQWLAQPEILTGYIGDGDTNSFAGATAKLALAVQVRGDDPTDFAGVDLVSRLLALQQPSGRFSDASPFGDFSNAFSQSLAVLTLDRTAAGAPAAAAGFLAGTRCADGGYPLLFAQPTCTSDVDATAMAVQALLAVGRFGDAAAGLDWLVSVQGSDGGFENSGGVANANSTGLAGQALRAGLRVLPAAKATLFLIDLQVGCAGAPADRGAVAPSADGFDPQTSPRATAQAVLGMAGLGFPHLTAHGSDPGAPTLACL